MMMMMMMIIIIFCHCVAQVDAFGRHLFVCKKVAGRSIRHYALNELVAIPNTKEPQGLCRSDGKGPNIRKSLALKILVSAAD